MKDRAGELWLETHSRELFIILNSQKEFLGIKHTCYFFNRFGHIDYYENYNIQWNEAMKIA